MSNFYKITSKKYLRALTWRKTTYTVSYLLVLESRVSQKVALNSLRPYWLSIFECFRTVFEQKCSFFMEITERQWPFSVEVINFESDVVDNKVIFVRNGQFCKKNNSYKKKIQKINKITKIWNWSFSTKIIIFFVPESFKMVIFDRN